ncbi:MAG: VWA domain-containing protein [Gammaproteobacteria bacterium]|nr:VWA domain-containing protein [Gammaproteobacteria bacterium]
MNTITENDVRITVSISKALAGFWKITPSLIAHPAPQHIHPKNIVFLLDISGSMNGQPLSEVMLAVSNLLDKLQPNDTFSIVTFNNDATPMVQCKTASHEELAQAKDSIKKISASGGTSFQNAFNGVNTADILPPNSHTSIIFLTDGQDHSSNAQALFAPFSKQKNLRIIPIGILDAESSLLNELARLSDTNALYINRRTPMAYQNAFDMAFRQAIAHSSRPATIDMTVSSPVQPNFTRLDVKRVLNRVCYDGESPTSTDIYLSAPTPIKHLELTFHCDDRSLQATRRLTSDEYQTLENGSSLELGITSFKWKNNSTYSWMLALGQIAIGLTLLAGTGLWVVSLPPFSLAIWQSIIMIAMVAMAGISLLMSGLIAVARKTIFLPTKAAAPEINTTKDAESLAHQNRIQLLFGRLKSALQTIIQHARSFLPSALIGVVLAIAGATAGYFIGTAGFAATMVTAIGISATGCAVSLGIALPLMVYGLKRILKIAAQKMRDSAPFILKGALLAAAGTTAGYYGGTTAFASTTVIAASGISASLFVTTCAVSAGIALPLLVYGCIKNKQQPARQIPSQPMSNHQMQKGLSFMLKGGLLAAAGTTAGYYGGTTAFASTAVIAASGISASLFVTTCAVSAGIALPLLVYGCTQYDSTPPMTNHHF